MSQDSLDEIEVNEESLELEEEQATAASLLESLYVPLGRPKSVGHFPLAFTVPDDLPPVLVESFTCKDSGHLEMSQMLFRQCFRRKSRLFLLSIAIAETLIFRCLLRTTNNLALISRAETLV